ncbi:MAG: DUF732 domain-containing protein [Mycobacterium sp.]
MRPRVLRTRLTLMALGAFLAGAVIGSMPSAKADGLPADQERYVVEFGESAMCPVLDGSPDLAGVLGVGLGIVGDGFAPEAAGLMLTEAVSRWCPRHMALLVELGSGQRAGVLL